MAIIYNQCNLPHYADSTTSRPICEVKQRQARVVLRWETTGEVRVQIIFYPPSILAQTLFVCISLTPNVR